MGILISVLFLIIIMSMFDVIQFPKDTKMLMLLFSAIAMSLLAGLREGVADLPEYKDIFLETPILSHFSIASTTKIHGEIGYLFVNSLIKSIGLGDKIMFLLISITSVSLTLYYYTKNSPYFLLSLLIYFAHTFLLRDMIQIRAGLAASIVLYSIKHIENRNFWKFSGVVIVAASFHAASMIMFVVYIMHLIIANKPKMQYTCLIVGVILGCVFSQSALEYAFLNIIDIPIVTWYMNDAQYFQVLGLLNPVLIKNIILSILLISLTNQCRDVIPYYSTMRTLTILSAFWLATFNNFAIIAARLATFFSIAEPIIIPVLLLQMKRYHKFAGWILIVLYSIVMFADKPKWFEDLSFSF